MSIPEGSGMILILPLLLIMVLLEWVGREDEFAISKIGYKWPKLVRYSFYASIIFLIGMFMQTTETPFIYFKF
jgi:hypothetical protein